MGSLSREQIEHYQEHGYVVVPGVLSDEDMQRYRERARAISLGDVPEEARNRVVRDIAYAKGELPLPEDPEHAVWKIINPDRFDDLFAEALRFPKVLDAVASLIGEDLLAFLLMFIYKPPGVPGSEHPFHSIRMHSTSRSNPTTNALGSGSRWIPSAKRTARSPSCPALTR